MAENYGVYEDQRKKFLDSYMQKESPFRMDDDLSKGYINSVLNENKDKNFVQRIIDPNTVQPLDFGNGQIGTHKMSYATNDNGVVVYPNIIQKGDQLTELPSDDAYKHAMKTGEYIPFDKPEDAAWFTENYKKSWDGKLPTGPQGAITKPNSDNSMAGFTPREEVSGTYGVRIGENGIANPMNTLEDVNKNVASFETPKDFTTEVIRGNQRSLYGYDKGGMAVPTIKNPWERENQEARASEIYNRAIRTPDDYSSTEQYDKEGNLIGESSSFKSNFGEGMAGYANAIKPGVNQDIAELRNQFAIDKMNNDWNKKFDLEQMKNNFRWSLKDHFGNKSDNDKEIKEEKKSLGASYGELRKTVDYILNPANGATEEERSRANQLKKKLPEYYTKDLNEVGSGRPALNIDYANSYVQGVGGGESSTSPIYANPPTPRTIPNPSPKKPTSSGLLDNTFNIPDIKNPIPNHIYRNKKNGRNMFYDGDNWRYSDSNSSTGWSWATRR